MANSISIYDVIKSLINQGVVIKEDGVITWSSCKYCNKSGWIASDSRNKGGSALKHDPKCFIEIAKQWITQEEVLNGL